MLVRLAIGYFGVLFVVNYIAILNKSIYVDKITTAEINYFYMHLLLVIIFILIGAFLAHVVKPSIRILLPRRRRRNRVLKRYNVPKKYLSIILLTLCIVNLYTGAVLFVNNGYNYGHYATFPIPRAIVFVFMFTGSFISILSSKKPFNVVFILCILALPFIIDCSRVAGIFVFLSSLRFYQNKNYSYVFISLVLSLFIYIFSILGRGGAPLDVILHYFLLFTMNGEITKLFAIENVSTVYYATQAEAWSKISGIERVFLFASYLSPVPSFLLDLDKLIDFVSFNGYLNISYKSIGFNADLLSEPINWFGPYYCYLFYFFMGCTLSVLDSYVKSLSNLQKHTTRTLIFACMVYFFALGSVASLRAATRPLMYLLVLRIFWRLRRLLSG